VAGTTPAAPPDRQHCAGERARSAGGSGQSAEPGETFADPSSLRAREASPFAHPGSEDAMWSHMKVFVLMAGLTALFGGLGSLVGGTTGLVVAIALAAAMNVAMYFWSAKVVRRSRALRVEVA
jgi:hypothetical protein